MSAKREMLGVAVVTGAAGGMGSACASRLAEQGWPLILCDLEAGKLERTAAPLRESAGQVDLLAGNIADAAFPDRLIAALGSARLALRSMRRGFHRPWVTLQKSLLSIAMRP